MMVEPCTHDTANPFCSDVGHYTCPIAADACAQARERYGEYAVRLLHPACLEAETDARPWWRFW